MNKKIIVYLLLASFMVSLYLYFNGRLFNRERNVEEQEVQKDEYPGYLPGMVNIKKGAEENIQDAIEKENTKINKALKNAGMENK
ncbi:hypothetical protein BMS3Abin15_00906 [bacterium BMS3Abin15]|nr:hypothetical protein BMS3Abin15_00906 [bacterium BMS3Abin15]HDH07755.1 hypothetical protein [Candidatus Moranbacteria bacterium]HDZ85447.1 hypothetical protein [Candidatus Moranbacteria bacterium]